MRPTPECRTFTSSAVEQVIEDMKGRLKDPDIARLFENTFPNTLGKNSSTHWSRSVFSIIRSSPSSLDTTVKYFNAVRIATRFYLLSSIIIELIDASDWEYSIYHYRCKDSEAHLLIVRSAVLIDWHIFFSLSFRTSRTYETFVWNTSSCSRLT